MWALKFDLSANVFSQILHENGFSPIIHKTLTLMYKGYLFYYQKFNSQIIYKIFPSTYKIADYLYVYEHVLARAMALKNIFHNKGIYILDYGF